MCFSLRGLKGEVNDEVTSLPIDGARVLLKRGGFPEDIAITDAEKYEFKSLAVADYIGKVISERYKDNDYTVSIQTGVTSGKSFLLKAVE